MNKIIQYRYNEMLYSFTTDGWFNATESAARFGKQPNEWLRLPATASYIAAFKRRYGNIPYVKTSRARADRGGGTWLHPKLAVRFAQWLDDDFAVWCDAQIDTIIRSGIQTQGHAGLLPLFLRATAAPWERRFPPDYYHALAKLTGCTYTGHAGGTPCLFGQITDRWVYALILPTDVHSELKVRRAQSEKMHQWLSEGGADILQRHLLLVTAIVQSSCDMRDFESRMTTLPAARGQMGIIFPATA